MKNKQHIRKSLILNQIVAFVVGVVILLSSFYGIEMLIDHFDFLSYVTMDDLLDQEDLLQQEAYDKIDEVKDGSCRLIVYDLSGGLIYTSDAELPEEDLFDMQDYVPWDYDEGYYSVYELDDRIGGGYFVERISYEGIQTGFCTLTEDLKIKDGTMWQDKEQLSQQEFDLLTGQSEVGDEVDKYSFTTDNGAERLLFFIAPAFDVEAYTRRHEANKRLWLLMIPIVLLVLGGYGIFLKKSLKAGLRPLTEAMETYSQGGSPQIDTENAPIEYDRIIRTFDVMTEHIRQAEASEKQEFENNQRIIAQLAHDLKTPMTVIQGYSQAMLDQKVDPDRQEAYLKAIFDKAKVTGEQLNTLFDYAKYMYPEYQMHPQDLDLADFCRNLLAERYLDIEAHGMALFPEIPETPIPYKGDPELLRHLMNNLLNNVLKHTPEGTKILFRVLETEEQIEIHVADTGGGISEAIRQRLYEPFVTGNEARTFGSGTGLGMVIALKIAQLHGGALTLEEAGYRGYSTYFTIRLPKNINR